jgi:KRAB domain-containing zinc finger protein
VKNGLKYHNTLVHGGIKHVENTATHHCEICNKDFSKKHGLENHMKWHIKAAHDGKKPFQCLLCFSRFHHKAEMNEHYVQVHENKKDLVFSFKCNFCSSIFDLKGKLKLHIQAVHKKTKPFQCDMRDSRFNHLSALHMHLRVHEASYIISTWEKT